MRQPDRCPGALRLHQAADGLLARVRLPGGYADASTLRTLADLADTFGDGRLEITSRGNVQIRAIAEEQRAALADNLAAAGLLPSLTHERVRNIVASASSDLAEVVGALDRQICGTLRLAELSGRFLFGIDDGTGDVASLKPDVLAARSADGVWLVRPGNMLVDGTQLAQALVAVAEAFLDVCAGLDDVVSPPWRINDLSERDQIDLQRRLDRVAREWGWSTGDDSAPLAVPAVDGDEFVVLQVPLGRLSSDQARRVASALVASAMPAARITPWRTVVLPGCPEKAALDTLEKVGLSIGVESVWNNLTACTGRPGCAKALADVQTDATAAAISGVRLPAAGVKTEGVNEVPVHWSGCERRCGKPAGAFVDVLATDVGYRVTLAR